MSARYMVIVLLACVLAPACAPRAAGDGSTFAQLTVAPGNTRAGAVVTLTLINRSERQLGYNLCAAALDRRVGGEWQAHPEPPAQVCTMELRILAAGASGTFQHTLPVTLPPGSYRFRTGVEWPLGEERVGVASESFEVERS